MHLSSPVFSSARWYLPHPLSVLSRHLPPACPGIISEENPNTCFELKNLAQKLPSESAAGSPWRSSVAAASALARTILSLVNLLSHSSYLCFLLLYFLMHHCLTSSTVKMPHPLALSVLSFWVLKPLQWIFLYYNKLPFIKVTINIKLSTFNSTHSAFYFPNVLPLFSCLITIYLVFLDNRKTLRYFHPLHTKEKKIALNFVLHPKLSILS